METATLDAMLATMRTDAESEYRQLVFALAAGEQAEPATLSAALAAAGRTHDDLRRHVRTAAERLEAAEALHRANELREQLPELESAHADADSRWRKEKAAAEEKMRLKLEPLDAAARDAAARLSEARSEEGRLRSSAAATLNKTRSPEAENEFARLSNAAVRSRNAAQAAAAAARSAGSASDRAETLERLTGELERARSHGAPLREIVHPLESRLAQACQMQDRAERLRVAAADAEAVATAAEQELAAFDPADWRAMRFD